MEIDVVKEKDNRILGRREVRFSIQHVGTATPKRAEVRQALAAKYSTDQDRVVVDALHAAFGQGATVGYAKIYGTKEAALKLETRPVLVRNLLAQKKEKKAVAAPDAAAKKGGKGAKK